MDDKYSGSPGARIAYVDPHQQERRPNINEIAIFHSKVRLISSPSDEVFEVLGKLIDTFRRTPYRTEIVGGPGHFENRGRNPRDDKISSFIDFLISDTENMEYIVDHVIAKKHGPLDPELRQELVDNIGDRSLWMFSEGIVITDSHERRESDKKLGVEFGFHPTDYFHVDGIVSGALRVVFAKPEFKPTQFKQGWYERSEDEVISIAEGSDERRSVLKPEPGSICLFGTRDDYHSQPDMTAEEFEKIGGNREVLSLTFEFDRLIERSLQNVAQRGSLDTKPKTKGLSL